MLQTKTVIHRDASVRLVAGTVLAGRRTRAETHARIAASPYTDWYTPNPSPDTREDPEQAANILALQSCD